MRSNISLLAITPLPIPSESFYGYVLRVSEANGYDSPWHVFRHAGLTQEQLIKSTTPAEPIARVVGHPVEDLQQLAWQRYPDGRPIPTLNRGVPRLLRHIDIVSPKICPVCVHENGYISPSWDLHIMIACPKHGSPLIRTCPHCNKPLSWYRPGMTTCNCGAALEPDTTTPVSPRVRCLLNLVEKVLDGDSSPLLDSDTMGLPQANLLSMQIDELLGLFERLRGFAHGATVGDRSRGKRQYTPVDVDAIAAAFEDWPKGFHRLLHGLSDGRAGFRDGATVRGRFERIYSNLFHTKVHQGNSLAFVRRAFVEFAVTPGNGVCVDPRMTKRVGIEESASQVLSAAALARRIGVDPRRIRALAEIGQATAISRKTVGRTARAVYEVGSELPKCADTGFMNERAAAARLGIPVSVLCALRQSGAYKVRHLGRSPKQFHCNDLDDLRDRLIYSLPTRCASHDASKVDLRAVFMMKFRTTDGKARLVEAILNRDIQPLERIGGRIPDIVIRRSDLFDFLAEEKHSKGGLIPGAWAAEVLKCEVRTIAPLIQSGHLKGIARTRYLRVTRASLEQFSSQYMSCAAIANAIGTTTSKVLRLCKRHCVEPLWPVGEDATCGQPFIERTSLLAAGIVLPTGGS
jgi:hypothetical protein